MTALTPLADVALVWEIAKYEGDSQDPKEFAHGLGAERGRLALRWSIVHAESGWRIAELAEALLEEEAIAMGAAEKELIKMVLFRQLVEEEELGCDYPLALRAMIARVRETVSVLSWRPIDPTVGELVSESPESCLDHLARYSALFETSLPPLMSTLSEPEKNLTRELFDRLANHAGTAFARTLADETDHELSAVARAKLVALDSSIFT